MPTVIARPRKGERKDRPQTWQVVWYLPLVPGEKRPRRVTETFHGTRSEAMEYGYKREAEVKQSPHTKTKITVQEWLDEWVRTYVKPNLRPTTQRSYRQNIDLYITPHLGTMRLKKITPSVLREWVALLAKPKEDGGHGLGPRSVAIGRQVLSEALDEAVRQEKLAENPLQRVPAPKQKPKVVRSYTRAEMRQLEKALEGHRLAHLFIFLWHTGLRIGEAIALRWDDVNLEKQTLAVRRNFAQVSGHLVPGEPKTVAGYREIALVVQTVEVLTRQRQMIEDEKHEPGWNPGGLVFPSLAGTPLSPRNVSRAWYTVRERAGIPTYGIHALRHTAASIQLLAGIGIPEIASALGHESPSFTARTYAHVLEETRRRASRKLERFLNEEEASQDDQQTK